MNASAYEAGAINPAVLSAVPGKTPQPQPPMSVNPAQLIATLSQSQSPDPYAHPRQHKMDEQRQAARIQPYLYPRPTPNSPAPQSPPPAPPAPALPPLPATTHLNPATTRITIVPLATSTTTIPALSPAEVDDVKAWMRIDSDYESSYRAMRDRMRRELVTGRARGWWEKAFVVPGAQPGDEPPASRWRRGRDVFEVRYPRRKDRDRRRNKREGLRLPRKLDIRDVNKPEQLVPIRLEFDVEHHKMRDTFVWNLNDTDPVVTPEAFAQSVVEDYALSPNYHAVITKSIQDQLSDYRAHSGLFDLDGDVPMPVVDLNEKEADPTSGRLGRTDDNERWWARWRRRVGRTRGQSRSRRKRRRVYDGEDDGIEGDVEEADDDDTWDKGKKLDEMEVDEAKMQEEMRILIRLDIIVGSMKLDDQFEWDLENEAVTPEEFAEIYVQDLGLNGEFKTAISHSIREQVQTYQKSLFLVGHPSDGSPVQDEDLRMSFLPSLTTAARALDQVSAFTPTLNYLSDGEIDRNEKEREKDMTRRRKRNTRGRRGVALPDRDPIRTCRTPAIGFPELDPATLALAAAASAPVSRRAAAAAASLTIANMVASENGTTFMPQMSTMPALAATALPMQMQMHKEKKPAGKGHFKPPPLPAGVLRPRARVGAPTPSTAADVATLPAPLENDPPPPLVLSSVPTVGGGAAGANAGVCAGAGAQTPDGRGGKVVTARRAKELEREAKEKEYADGQHPNMIDGVWHCSNCGCPDSIAVGRRKGPLGDKSQCGVCGKYWHRHRRPRPVEYNPDPEYHSGLKRELEQTKAVASAKKKGGGGAGGARTQTRPQTPAESEPQTPARSHAGEADAGAGAGGFEDERAVSPVSTASSASEPPLAQRMKTNGAARRVASPVPLTPVMARGELSSPARTPVNAKGSAATGAGAGVGMSPMSPVRNAEPPQWLVAAKAAMMARYPNDRFETILRKVNAGSQPEWRIKCLDCPGKLYTPGPGETLANYEVHLKNRQHRQRVNDRLNNEGES
ncbi:hypothetical protein C0992_001027 [Termitomyces sp. T32_za158]|nr:hypothetical protein C0992_001027 [Termitomyces sp. T32_za158]